MTTTISVVIEHPPEFREAVRSIEAVIRSNVALLSAMAEGAGAGGAFKLHVVRVDS